MSNRIGSYFMVVAVAVVVAWATARLFSPEPANRLEPVYAADNEFLDDGKPALVAGAADKAVLVLRSGQRVLLSGVLEKGRTGHSAVLSAAVPAALRGRFLAGHGDRLATVIYNGHQFAAKVIERWDSAVQRRELEITLGSLSPGMTPLRLPAVLAFYTGTRDWTTGSRHEVSTSWIKPHTRLRLTLSAEACAEAKVRCDAGMGTGVLEFDGGRYSFGLLEPPEAGKEIEIDVGSLPVLTSIE